MLANVGVVVIGRNEGNRLEVCLNAVRGLVPNIVYVDSGSSDHSVRIARGMNIGVLELDRDAPFTAARARNEGFRYLRLHADGISYVQFVDGDCELHDNWLATAAKFLDDRSDVAAVCGRLRERFPEKSIYNTLCDIEWDGPTGEVKACGGNAMVRAVAFENVQGFRRNLIAGEEPELSVRLRADGWRIFRLQEEMALHDAAIYRFSQWWTRTLRTGYAYAEGAFIHGAPPERHFIRESRSAWIWGLAIPLAIVGFAPWTGAWAIAALLIYPLQIVRLSLQGNRPPRENLQRAGFLVLGKFPEVCGQIKFLIDLGLKRRNDLIEYK